jgi:uncharacterized protein YpuA (DUF1002 family)
MFNNFTVKSVSMVVMVAIMLTLGTSAAFAASSTNSVTNFGTVAVNTDGSYSESGDLGDVHIKDPNAELSGAELWTLYVKIKKEQQVLAQSKTAKAVKVASITIPVTITDNQLETLVDYCSTDEFLDTTHNMTRTDLKILRDLFREYATRQMAS